jgi:hypothetical protein
MNGPNGPFSEAGSYQRGSNLLGASQQEYLMPLMA